MGRIGIYGGTFNPPHAGHGYAAGQAVRKLSLDRLLLVPASIPPHKSMPEGTPRAEVRLDLVRLAARQIPRAEACDLELRRPGKSYTADTVLELRRQYPDDDLILLMGTDMLLSFLQWYRPDSICRNAALAVLYRGGEKRAVLDMAERQAEQIRSQLGGRVTFVENDALAISSTDVRRMLTFQCASTLLPAGVMDRIQEMGLYGVNRGLRGLPLSELERTACALLDPKRVNHVLGCRDTAVRLARRYDADPTDAARAALLHDVTKAVPPILQLKLCEKYGIIMDDFFRKNPKTLHAVTGAAVARHIFGEREAVCDAIAWHTTGRPGMSVLEKILYVADYIEPNRNFPGVELLRSAADKSLEEALLLGLELSASVLKQEKRQVAPASQQAMAALKGRKVP